MTLHRGPPSQAWRTFLRNHADAIAGIDLCVVPTLTFECLFAFLVVGHGRQRLLWFAVHPPFGINIFVAQSVLGLNLDVIYRGIIPFVIIYLVALALITYFPDISLVGVRYLLAQRD